MNSATTSRRARWSILVVRIAMVFVAGRLLLAAIVPFTVERAARAQGFDVTWSKLRVHYSRAALEIDGLTVAVRAPDGSPPNAPWLRTEVVRVDLALIDLVAGEVRVQRAEFSGVDVVAERRADRTIPVFEAIESALSSEKPTKPTRPAPMSFASPVRIDELRVEHLRIDVRDAALSGAQTWRVDVDLKGDDLGYADRRGRIEVRASGANLVDALRVDVDIEARADDAVIDVQAHAGGLSSATIAPWVAEMAGHSGLSSDPSVVELDADFRLGARLRTDGSARDGVAGSIVVLDASVTTDGATAGRLARASIDVKSFRRTGIHVGSIEVESGAVSARRAPDGALCAFGFAVREVSESIEPANQPVARPAFPFDVAVDVVQANALQVTVRDEVFEPAAGFEAVLDKAVVTGIDTRASNDAPIRVEVEASVSGVAAKLSARGVASVFGERKRVELDLEASGVRPDALAPHLAELGVASTLKDGALSAKIVGFGMATASGGVTGDVRLTDVKLVDGEQLFALRAIEALGVSIEPLANTLHVRDLSVRGTDLPLERAADGSFAGLGFHTIAAASSRRAVAAQPTNSATAGLDPTQTTSRRELMRIEIDRIAVVENRFRWRDDRLAKPVDVVFDDCGLEISNLALFGDPTRDERTTATVKIWSRAQDVVREVAIAGTIATRPGTLDLALELTGKVSGITAARLQPYIDPTGIEERLQEASISGSVALQLAQQSNGLRANLELRDVEFRNADASFTGAKLVRVKDAVVAPERLDVTAIEVVDGRLNVSRDPVGALLALGFRIPLSVFQGAQSNNATSAAPPEVSKAERFLSALPDVRIGSVRVTNAELTWNDQAFTPALETIARLDVDVQEFSTRAKEASKFTIAIGIGDTAADIRVEGEARIRPGAAFIAASCKAGGLRAGTLAPYLPNGVACELVNGRLEFRGAIAVSELEAGGLGGLIEVSGVHFGEDGAERPLLVLDRFELSVGRADPAAQVFEIGRVLVSALELDVRRDAEGRTHALGFVLGDASEGASQSDQPEPASAAQTAANPAAPSRSFPDLTPPGSPRVVLDELDLELSRLTFRDEARGTQPIDLAGRVMTLGGPQVLVDLDPTRLKPFTLAIEVGAKPFARSVVASFSASPFAEEPTLRAAFAASGISGAGLDALGRDLSTWIDGTQLSEGVAKGSIEAKLRWKRRSPLDLDFRGGIAADVEIGRFEFRDAPDGRVLVALDGGSADVARIDLATGSVHVKTLELRKPEMHARRTADGGIEILGLVVHPENRLRADGAATEPADEASPGSAMTEVANATSPRPEFRIDELIVRGIDVELRDDAATPPTVLPLVDLDVLVQRFTTRAFEEPRVIRFDAWLGAGEAEMPRPERAASLLSGIASAVGDVLEGQEEKLSFEKRRIFQEAALTGRIQFVPELTGHAQATLSGLELLGFTGTAKHEGLDLGDGTLDASSRLRFRGAEGLRVDTELVFSDLSLAEPKSGPIETYLTLPVPLDAVLFLLENSDGEHRIPVGFTLDEEGLTTARITTAAAGAAASVIGTAIASAPLRVLSTFTDLFGFTGGEEDPPPSAQLAFAPGATELSGEARTALDPLVRKMRADADFVVQVQHRLGPADVARAEMLANPSPEDCREIVDGLRRRRAELARERGELAADLRATWGAGDHPVAEATTLRLRALDAEAGHVEDALDRMLELLKPGAERQRGKRTRAAALAVARQRIEVLRAWFAVQGIRDLEMRFEAKFPVFEVSASDAPGSVLAVLRER